mmetsp:Transcript_8342/g.11646  ORF Transcript_8342/g.11646 Transcript_8342/m.11646 type:complete len:98 (-) Transcript_8342:7-300(-)
MSENQKRSFTLLSSAEADEENPVEAQEAGGHCCFCSCCPSCLPRCPKKEDCTLSSSLKRKLVFIYICIWLGLVLFVYSMIMAGVFSTVVGNLLTYQH